ncbi:hypothetical protein EBU24_00295 [bacterium]|nr:hypothetical protein [bacterium]
MKYLYEIRLNINNKKNKYKASINKKGGSCIPLCASSDKEAIEILQKCFLFYDKRPIKNKSKIGDFRLKDGCSKYIFLLCSENVDSYIRDYDHK